jgi:hypothetical protein
MNEPIEIHDSISYDCIIDIDKKYDEKSTSTIDIIKNDEKSTNTDINNKNDFKKLKNDILKEFIYPKYKNDLNSFVLKNKRWALASSIFIVMKYFFLLSSPIFSLAENSFKINNQSLRFITASFSLLGLACDQLAKFCNNNSKKFNDKINSIYKTFNINIINIDELIDDKSLN